MKAAEGRGPTLDEAVDAALIQLGESRRNVDVKILAEGPSETVVEVSVIEAALPAGAGASSDPDAEKACELVGGLVKRMGIKADVTVRQSSSSSDQIVIDVGGRDLGVLIGWRGESLRALQGVTNMMVSRGLSAGRHVIVDVERYRQRREHTVQEIAYRAARQVKVTGDPITLDPMQPFERRAIHMALDSDPDVTTVSIGEEPERRVVVEPRREVASLS